MPAMPPMLGSGVPACAVLSACSGAGNADAARGDSGWTLALWPTVFGDCGFDGCGGLEGCWGARVVVLSSACTLEDDCDGTDGGVGGLGNIAGPVDSGRGPRQSIGGMPHTRGVGHAGGAQAGSGVDHPGYLGDTACDLAGQVGDLTTGLGELLHLLGLGLELRVGIGSQLRTLPGVIEPGGGNRGTRAHRVSGIADASRNPFVPTQQRPSD